MSWLAEQILAIPLQGSDKQVQWARSLRSQKVAFFDRLTNRGVLRALQPAIVEDDIHAMNAWDPIRISRLAAYVVLHACRNPSARHWIDNRDDDPISWLTAAYQELRPQWLAHPFPDE